MNWARLSIAPWALVMVLLSVTNGVGQELGIEVVDAWARAPLIPGRPVAVYFTLVNNGAGDDRLLGARTDIAAKVTSHQSVVADGIARMRAITDVIIPAGDSVEFAPGGLHLMLMNPARDLSPGDVFPLTLLFEKAGARDINVCVTDG